eukprot:403359950
MKTLQKVCLAAMLISFVALSLVMYLSNLHYVFYNSDGSISLQAREVAQQIAFTKYLNKYSKQIIDWNTYIKRQGIFISNKRLIDDHNFNNKDFKLDYNEFSDLTNDEYVSQKLGFQKNVSLKFTDVNGTRLAKIQKQMRLGEDYYLNWQKQQQSENQTVSATTNKSATISNITGVLNVNSTSKVPTSTSVTIASSINTNITNSVTTSTGSLGLKELVKPAANLTGSELKLPVNLDWRFSNIVTTVKDQGSCGSCYAFSALANVESLLLQRSQSKYKSVDLSEQQIVDCTARGYGNSGCRGGDMMNVFEYLRTWESMTEGSYPYIGKDQRCKFDLNTGVTLVEDYYFFQTYNPDDIKEFVARFPVTVGLDASSSYFRFYSSGIITTTKCGTGLNHAVLIIGYGNEGGIDYWLIKNQYGIKWGERGFAKIMRSADQGICGLNQYVVIPIMPTL